MGFVKLFSFVFFIVHWVGCIFFFIAYLEYDGKTKTWLDSADLDLESSNFNLYIASVSWAFTTMTTVGYGDVYPVTATEKIFGTVAMIIACGVFAFIVGSISSIIDQHSTLADEFSYFLAYLTF